MDLSGKFLIAMPALSDPRFERSVVLIISHSDTGSMGLIINKPLTDISFSSLLDQIGIARGEHRPAVAVHYGGPVETGRGFVLHDDSWTDPAGTLQVPGGLAMTATQTVLTALAEGRGPQRALLALGYAGWSGGQLESELSRNDWLTADATAGLVFGTGNPTKWAEALASLGVDPLSLSATAGRA